MYTVLILVETFGVDKSNDSSNFPAKLSLYSSQLTRSFVWTVKVSLPSHNDGLEVIKIILKGWKPTRAQHKLFALKNVMWLLCILIMSLVAFLNCVTTTL